MVDTAGVIASAIPLNNNDFVPENQESALRGVAVKQAQGGLNAFQGIDFNDPTSVSNGVTNLIKSGNLDKASALAGLNFQQQIRSTLPTAMNLLQDVTGRATQSTQGGNSAASNQQPTIQDQAGHASQTLDLAANTLQQIKSLPPEQREAAFAQAKEQLAARGVPTGAIDNVSEAVLGLPDKESQDNLLDQLTSHYQDHSQHLNAVSSGNTLPTTAPSTAPSGVSSSWFNNFVKDPQFPQLEAMLSGLKGQGYDLTPMLETAKSLALPEIQKEAEAANARTIASESSAGSVPAHLAEELGKHQINLAFMDADALAAAKKAGAVTSAEEQAKNPNEFTTVKGPNNEDIVVRKDYALAHAGQNGGLLVSSMTPTEQEFQKTQADAAAKVLTPDNDYKIQSQSTVDNSNRAISILDKINTNDLTAFKKQAADALRTIPGLKNPEKYATDIAGYQQLSTQALTSGARQAFPQRVTDRDIKLLQGVYPQISTPKDQAKIAFGTQAAVAQRNLDYENFKAQYNGPHTPQAIQQAWNQQEGNRSNFQSPVWANITLGGRPAFNPATDIKIVQGKKIGAWGIGTGHPVYFEIQ